MRKTIKPTATSIYTNALRLTVQRIAGASKKARTETEPLHVAYCNATYETEQKELREQFMVDWIIGDYSSERILSDDEALIILRAGKGKNDAINPQVIDRATAGFRYHVIRPDSTVEVVTSSNDAGKTEKSKGKPATKAELAAMQMFITMVGSRTRALELLNGNGK